MLTLLFSKFVLTWTEFLPSEWLIISVLLMSNCIFLMPQFPGLNKLTVSQLKEKQHTLLLFLGFTLTKKTKNNKQTKSQLPVWQMQQTNSCCFAPFVSNGGDKKCCSAAVVVQAVSGVLPGLTRFCNYALPAACLDHLLPNNAEFSPLMYEMLSNLQIQPQLSLFKPWEPLFLFVGCVHSDSLLRAALSTY